MAFYFFLQIIFKTIISHFRRKSLKYTLKYNNYRKISELTDGARNVDLEAEVSEKGETRTVNTRFGNEANVADVKIKDDSGEITLSLWNEDINKVDVGTKIKIGNGYTNSFRGETKLNVGRYGTLDVVTE